MPCLCPSCTPNPAETWTDEFRHETECKHFLNMANNRERVAYVEAVASKRGKTAADRLRADVRSMMRVVA